MKWSKRIVAVVLSVVMMIGMTGCGFSVGNVRKTENYKNLFPDKAATLGKSYKTSNIGYRYTLGDDGAEMMIHVDTSEGHTFEVTNNPAGFKVKDQDGKEALYGIFMERNQYEQYSAFCDEVKTINGRDFLYVKNGDGSEDCYSYMADCGLDYGLVLEVHDGKTENFGLVAFRGNALEGAKSDVRYYQGDRADASTHAEDEGEKQTEETGTGDEGEEDDTEKYDEPHESESLTTSTLNSEIQASLDALETDYAKVKWGVQYSISQDLPGVVISVTPSKGYFSNELVVAVTNLYDKDISFSGSAKAKDANDNIIGETFIYNSCIGSGNTIIDIIDCEDKVPDGRIQWSEVDIREALGEYVPWEADYSAKGHLEDGYVTVDYSLYSASGETCSGDLVILMLLDENGFVVGHTSDYVGDLAENEKYAGSVEIYGHEENLSLAKNLAIFANPCAE